MEKILSGVRVLDFTDAMAGPFCARYLADCGCDVINVERPGGKVARSLPYFQDGHCSEFIQNHCGKKSITIDLKAEGARELLLKLAKVSDVVLENFRPGVMASFGLGYEDFKAVNHSIIMCSISGWGQTGPNREDIGVDLLVQSSRGIAYMMSEPGQRPVFVAFALSDILAGLNAFGAICAALYRRSISGQGDYIDIAMGDCALASLGNAVGADVLSQGKADFRYMAGSFSPDLSPCGAFKGRDGYLTVYARTDVAWTRLAELMGKPELGTDPRFSTIENRLKNNDAVTEVIEEWLQNFEHVSEVAALLQSYRILAAPILTVGQVVSEDPQTKARDMLVEMEHPTLGPFRYLNTPLRFTNSNAGVDAPPPVQVGEHMDYVLRDVLNFDDAEIEMWQEKGVVFSPANPETQ